MVQKLGLNRSLFLLSAIAGAVILILMLIA